MEKREEVEQYREERGTGREQRREEWEQRREEMGREPHGEERGENNVEKR